MYNIGTQTIYSVQFIVEGVIFKHIVVKKLIDNTMEKLPRSNPAFRSTNKNAIRC